MKVNWDLLLLLLLLSSRCLWFESPSVTYHTYHKIAVCKALFEVCNGVYISLINLLST